jgi:hypothetical protein
LLNRFRLNDRIYLYLLLLVLWWIIGCEFKVPTTPRLPARWNSKLILPLLDKSYSFQDLVLDSATNQGNQIFADTSLDRMYYFAVDTPGQKVSIDVNTSNTYWKIPALTITKVIDLHSATGAKLNEPVDTCSTTMSRAVSTHDNRMIKGILSINSEVQVNSATVTASLSDTLSNDIEIEVTTRNFGSSLTGEVRVDTLYIAADSLTGSLDFSFMGDSLFSINRQSYLDSLEFDLKIMIQDTLRETLSQDLDVRIEVGELQLENFYGRVIAHDYLTGQEFISSPRGADSIHFAQANADFIISDLGNFDSLYILVTGKKIYQAQSSIDTAFTISGTEFSLDIGKIMSNLPDSITFYVEAAMPLATYNGSSFSEEITIGYQLYAPLEFTLPGEMYLSAAKSTRFFIADSLTRAKIVNSQDGAEFDIYVTNRTPFDGSICLLIGNYDFFPSDTTEIAWVSNYQYINDTLYYVAADTNRVIIDTLAVFDLPLPGAIGEQYFMADSSALSLLADTCYFLPKFTVSCSDTNAIQLKTSYAIDIKSYLNLLFDAAALNQSVEDTTQ